MPIKGRWWRRGQLRKGVELETDGMPETLAAILLIIFIILSCITEREKLKLIDPLSFDVLNRVLHAIRWSNNRDQKIGGMVYSMLISFHSVRSMFRNPTWFSGFFPWDSYTHLYLWNIQIWTLLSVLLAPFIASRIVARRSRCGHIGWRECWDGHRLM